MRNNAVKRLAMSALFLLAGMPFLLAQNQIKVSGKVTDDLKESMIGVSVFEKGTTNGTVTDIEGRFSLNVAPGATLVVSYIGYTTSEIVVGNKTDLAISLKEDSEMLDEVVVVGYGTMKKKDLTGAVAAVKGDDLAARKTTQLSTALQGAASGVTVTRDNSAPGATASIQIRGVTTIGETSPLVIVDGIPGDINQVNLKSATKLFSVLLASKRPLITELADKLRLKYPLLPTISPCPTMRLEAIRSIIPISCRRYPKSV